MLGTQLQGKPLHREIEKIKADLPKEQNLTILLFNNQLFPRLTSEKLT